MEASVHPTGIAVITAAPAPATRAPRLRRIIGIEHLSRGGDCHDTTDITLGHQCGGHLGRHYLAPGPRARAGPKWLAAHRWAGADLWPDERLAAPTDRDFDLPADHPD